MFSFHTHTEYCDGKSTIEEICDRAVELNMSAVAFTSHAPVPFKNTFSISFEKIFEYKKAVEAAKNRYAKDLNIYLGLEADFIPKQSVSFDNWRNLIDTDFVIGSVHLVKDSESGLNWFIDGDPSNYHIGLKEVFHSDIKRAVRAYFHQINQMVETENPEIIGHIDKVKMNNQGLYFSTKDSFYQDALHETLEVVRNSGAIIEINSRGIYKGRHKETFPSVDIIKTCVKMGIPLTLASDSHHVDDLDKGYNLANLAAIEAGVNEISMFDGEKWILKAVKESVI